MKKITKYIDCINYDIVFKIGENSQDNFDMIDDSLPDDIWFHVNNLPSAHIIASLPLGKKLDKKQLSKIITQGAVICKQYSRYASQKNLKIVYTKVKFVKKTEIIGSVETNVTKIVTI
uniref:NFACT RNA-binding domain-containing protein n=1 Tax=viral metagenome TaxID=1070528 RepID=A0A6C0JKA8_9ZZZZ